MIAIVFALAVVILGAAFYLSRKPENYPPGPPWLPFVGNLPLLKRLSRRLGGQHLALLELARRFDTNVLGLKLGGSLVVVVSSHPLIRDVLASEEYEARPDNFFVRLRSLNTRKGITFTNGELWMEQRCFVVRHLRTLGFGKKTMEALITEEIREVLRIIEADSARVQIGRFLAPAVINVLWSLTAGERIDRGDGRLRKLFALLEQRSRVFDMAGGLLAQHPWLRFIVPEKVGYNLIKRLNSELKDFFMETIQEHHQTWSEAKSDDLIYSFITQMKAVEGRLTTFTDDQLLMVCLDLFIAGSQTTSNTLDFAFLMMLLHPDIQDRCQRVLDKTFDLDQALSYEDRKKVPYIEAVLLEVERYSNVVPVIGPRQVLKNTTLNGYSIPKDATILLNVYSAHMSEDVWGDPEAFKPERFLNPDGSLAPKDALMPFGLGRRRCLGDALARSCIFLFFTEIMRVYDIEPLRGQPLPSSTPRPGLTLAPKEYFANFVRRCNL